MSQFQHPYPEHTRVHHSGQQWPEAQDRGTAEIIEAVAQRDGTYEYRVRRDEPLVPGGDLETWWASYRTNVALDEHFKALPAAP